MGACGRCMLISTLVLAVGVGMLFNVTIPKGFQDANSLRLFFGIFKVYDIVVSAHKKSKWPTTRWFYSSVIPAVWNTLSWIISEPVYWTYTSADGDPASLEFYHHGFKNVINIKVSTGDCTGLDRSCRLIATQQNHMNRFPSTILRNLRHEMKWIMNFMDNRNGVKNEYSWPCLFQFILVYKYDVLSANFLCLCVNICRWEKHMFHCICSY